MSEAALEPVEEGEATPTALNPRRKKLIIIIAAAVLVLAVAGGAAAFIMKKRAAAAAQAAEDGETSQAEPAHDAHAKPPAFLPLDAFVVNLADRDTDRFAQIGITLELQDQDTGEKLKAYMPAIRNAILLVLSQKTSQQLMGRAGKEALAAEIVREAVRPLGLNLPDEADPSHAAKSEDDDDEDAPTPAAHGEGGDRNPIRRVHFSSFIIQ